MERRRSLNGRPNRSRRWRSQSPFVTEPSGFGGRRASTTLVVFPRTSNSSFRCGGGGEGQGRDERRRQRTASALPPPVPAVGASLSSPLRVPSCLQEEEGRALLLLHFSVVARCQSISFSHWVFSLTLARDLLVLVVINLASSVSNDWGPQVVSLKAAWTCPRCPSV